MTNLEIKHGKSFEADLFNGPERVASAQFYGEETLGEAAALPGYGNEFLVVKIDPRLADPSACGAHPREYARKVAQMVYEMMVF